MANEKYRYEAAPSRRESPDEYPLTAKKISRRRILISLALAIGFVSGAFAVIFIQFFSQPASAQLRYHGYYVQKTTNIEYPENSTVNTFFPAPKSALLSIEPVHGEKLQIVETSINQIYFRKTEFTPVPIRTYSIVWVLNETKREGKTIYFEGTPAGERVGLDNLDSTNLSALGIDGESTKIKNNFDNFLKKLSRKFTRVYATLEEMPDNPGYIKIKNKIEGTDESGSKFTMESEDTFRKCEGDPCFK
jgi:hypothetical protein